MDECEIAPGQFVELREDAAIVLHGQAAYVFGLSRQEEAPYADCWMTDRVDRVPLPREMEAESREAI